MKRLCWFWSKLAAGITVCIVVATGARADASLSYETIQPAKIVIGESAILRITSLDSELRDVKLPNVSGLTFEVLGHTRAMEFNNGIASESSSIVIRVTPQIAGIFSIPGPTPKSQPLILEVLTDRNAGNPPLALNGKAPRTPPPPTPKTGNTAGIHFEADGSAFVQLKMPKRAVYVGESVPVDIEVGVRPGMVTALNGLPSVKGGDFTLNNLSRQPERREEILDGKPFLKFVWHSVLAAVKPGDFTLTVDTPLTVKISTRPAEDEAFANLLGGPFLQNFYSGIVPKELTVTSQPSELHVLALPTSGRPADFTGAVGTFKVSSDVSALQIPAGDPLTLRMHVSGEGNFDRVDTQMLDRNEQWKTYPPKSSFSSTDPVGYRGEKIFEQPLIAAQSGEQTIPGLSFSYFDPETKRYERAQTAPIKVAVDVSRAANSLKAPEGPKSGSRLANRTGDELRPDHALTPPSASLVPLYLQPRFLAIPATLALLFAGGLIALRRAPHRVASKAAERALAHLSELARIGDSSRFYVAARELLLHSFAQAWHVPAEEITASELDAHLDRDAAQIGRLFALADEAKYSGRATEGSDLSQWLQLVSRHLGEAP
jgi:BatD DUF11 like domain